MAESVDQDVREAALTFGGWDSAQAVLDGRADRHKIVQALARMKAAGREQGLREAAEFVRTHVANYSTAKIEKASFPIPARSSQNMAAAIEALLSENPA